MSTAPFDPQPFLDAQERDHARALAEVQAGRKRSHWIWYVFPQVAGIPELHGRVSSPTSRQYGLLGLDHARAYLDHPVLRARYVEVLEAAAAHIVRGGGGYDAVTTLFGSRDNSKFVSSLTLFEAAAQGSEHGECGLIVRTAAGLFSGTTLRRCEDTPRLLASAGH